MLALAHGGGAAAVLGGRPAQSTSTSTSSSSGAASPTCKARLERLCWNATHCFVCAGTHQAALRQAGCSPADVQSLCAAAPTAPRAPIICAGDGDGKLIAFRGGTCPSGSSRTRVAGVNIFDAMWDASSAMGSPHPGGHISIANTTAALAAAAASHVRVFRMFGGLWGPHMSFWVANEQQYWVEFDAVMDAITEQGLYVVPSIGYSSWWWSANQANPGLNETLNDFILNGSSVGRALANKYFTQIVTRYSKRECVLLWELGK
jgi:hypothetical protein